MRDTGLFYFALGVISVMVNWYYYHNVIYAILAWVFWPVYLIYALLNHQLVHADEIVMSYFK